MTDTIELRGIRAFGHHGADPGEKVVAQPFDIDVWFELDLTSARRSDALGDTVDYATLHATIVRLVRERSYDLIERLGADVLDAVLADARVARASVRIAKPELLAGATPAVVLHAARA
ncbi:MAG TPA: dihydroneopterin aldolase [Candidatus Lustribacter sp.]